MKAKNDFRMTIDSRSINEAFSRSSVAAFAAQLDPTVDEITDIKTANFLLLSSNMKLHVGEFIKTDFLGLRIKERKV